MLVRPLPENDKEPDCLATERLAGYALCDPLGRHIGRVSRVFVDGEGSPAHAEVALGFLNHKTVLVPVVGWEEDQARRTLVLNRRRKT